MKQIKLDSPCNIDSNKLHSVNGGWDCSECSRKVVDYSTMTDAQMLSHIKRHGMGCGNFRIDQLSRPLRKGRFAFLAILIGVFSFSVRAQDSTGCKDATYQKVQKPIVFGTGNVATLKQPPKQKQNFLKKIFNKRHPKRKCRR